MKIFIYQISTTYWLLQLNACRQVLMHNSCIVSVSTGLSNPLPVKLSTNYMILETHCTMPYMYMETQFLNHIFTRSLQQLQRKVLSRVFSPHTTLMPAKQYKPPKPVSREEKQTKKKNIERNTNIGQRENILRS